MSNLEFYQPWLGRGYPANSDRLEHFSAHDGCCCHPRDNKKLIDAVQNPLGLQVLHGTSFFRGRALDLWPKLSCVTCFSDWLVWFNHIYYILYIEKLLSQKSVMAGVILHSITLYDGYDGSGRSGCLIIESPIVIELDDHQLQQKD